MDNYFSAGNTPSGFVNYFNDTSSEERISQILYIKGGSGVGKSTLMREVAQIGEDRGYHVTRIYCSSDPKSLDGVVIGDRIALFDATMPHISDPQFPALSGSIINLAEYLDSAKLACNSTAIVECVKEKKAHYSVMYTMLSAIRGISTALNGLTSIENSLYSLGDALLEHVEYADIAPRRGFLSAIDVDKIVDITLEIATNKQVYAICSNYPNVARSLVSYLASRMTIKGIPHQEYHSIIEPDRLDTVVTAHSVFTTSPNVTTANIVDVDNMASIKNEHAYHILGDNIDSIVALAQDELSGARNAHNRLEEYYQQAMDYIGLEQYKHSLIDRLIHDYL